MLYDSEKLSLLIKKQLLILRVDQGRLFTLLLYCSVWVGRVGAPVCYPVAL